MRSGYNNDIEKAFLKNMLGRRRKNVIKSFADKDTESIFHQEYVKGIPQDIQKRALRKK